MSRMLDVLEEFLTLHGHTYVRLDGSTGVEKRQRLMDRQGSASFFFLFFFELWIIDLALDWIDSHVPDEQ